MYKFVQTHNFTNLYKFEEKMPPTFLLWPRNRNFLNWNKSVGKNVPERFFKFDVIEKLRKRFSVIIFIIDLVEGFRRWSRCQMIKIIDYKRRYLMMVVLLADKSHLKSSLALKFLIRIVAKATPSQSLPDQLNSLKINGFWRTSQCLFKG